MGRKPIEIEVIVTPNEGKKFRCKTIPEVSEKTGVSVRAVRNAYYSKRQTITRASDNEKFNLKWLEPYVPPDYKICSNCKEEPLKSEDRSSFFHIIRIDVEGQWRSFTSLHHASRLLGISRNALVNACNKANTTITSMKESKKYQIHWTRFCSWCDGDRSEVKGGELI